MSDLDNVYESTDAYQSESNPAYGECPKLQDFSSVSQEKKLVNEEAKKKPSCDRVYCCLCVWLVLLSIVACVGLGVALGSIVLGNSAASSNSNTIQSLRQDLDPGPDADVIHRLRE